MVPDFGIMYLCKAHNRKKVLIYIIIFYNSKNIYSFSSFGSIIKKMPFLFISVIDISTYRMCYRLTEQYQIVSNVRTFMSHRLTLMQAFLARLPSHNRSM